MEKDMLENIGRLYMDLVKAQDVITYLKQTLSDKEKEIKVLQEQRMNGPKTETKDSK